MSKNKEIEALFKAKHSYHKELAKLPFPEKIKIVIELQKLANSITKRKRMVWRP